MNTGRSDELSFDWFAKIAESDKGALFLVARPAFGCLKIPLSVGKSEKTNEYRRYNLPVKLYKVPHDPSYTLVKMKFLHSRYLMLLKWLKLSLKKMKVLRKEEKMLVTSIVAFVHHNIYIRLFFCQSYAVTG